MQRFSIILVAFVLFFSSLYAVSITTIESDIKEKVMSHLLAEYTFIEQSDVDIRFSFSETFETTLKKSESVSFDIDSVDRFLGRTSLMVTFYDKLKNKLAKDYLFITVKAKANYVKVNQRVKKRSVITKDMVSVEKLAVYGKPYNSIHSINEILGKESVFDIGKGTYITTRLIQSIPLLRKGTRVSLIMKKNNVEIVVPGELLSDGSVGNMVKAKTLFKSPKYVRGLIVDGENVVISSIN